MSSKPQPTDITVAVESFGERKHLAFTVDHYSRCNSYNMSSVRAGHSDAAHMCDAIAADILRENTNRGRTTKTAREQIAAVKRAGDAIWAMMEKFR